MERALLANVRFNDPPYRDSWPQEESALELAELARSSGRVEVLESISVSRDRPTPTYLVGKGKVQEIHDRCHLLKANVVIFGRDLNFPQQRNLEEGLGVKVLDRTQLILDIFAQRARSQEGKVQVELAQLQYLLPRLAGKGTLLSRLGGGIGTRGPGEQKLEMDRRRIRERISRLSRELQEIHRRRGVARQKREEEEIPTVALVGYTNVGKSTLLNRLTQAGAAAENRLFTTLDPLARRLELPNHQPILLSDTVGFLHRLPHHLIDAFRATLEEVTECHLILHLLDGSHPMLKEQEAAVHEVLESLQAEKKPMVVALNKTDRLDPASRGGLRRRYPGAVFISALTGEGMKDLVERLMTMLSHQMRHCSVWIPHQEQGWVERIYRQGQVLKRQTVDDHLVLEVRVPHRLYGQLEKRGLLKRSP